MGCVQQENLVPAFESRGRVSVSGIRAETGRDGRRLRVSRQTLVKPSPLHGHRRHNGNSFSFTQGGQLQYYTYGRGGAEAVCRRRRQGRGFLYTVYSECIVTCVCCQVLLNYIFVCNVETNVSFLYGGTTGSEQSDL